MKDVWFAVLRFKELMPGDLVVAGRADDDRPLKGALYAWFIIAKRPSGTDESKTAVMYAVFRVGSARPELVTLDMCWSDGCFAINAVRSRP